MISRYQNLVNDLKKTLQVFNFKLLFYRLLRGGVMIGGTIFLFLIFFYFLSVAFSFTVFWKTIFYYFFWFVIFSEFLAFTVYPFILFILCFYFKNDFLLKRILKSFSPYPDIFISVYNLAFHNDLITGDDQLKKAAFVQKYNFLKADKSFLSFPVRLLLRQIFLFLILFLAFTFYHQNFRNIYNDLNAYESIRPKYELSFHILNESLEVEYGKKYELKLQVKSNDYKVDQVFICYGGGEFLMTKKDSLFVYDFEAINNDIQFNFKALDLWSEFYTITVLPAPAITSYKVTLIPPSYTGLKSEVQTNVVDFRVLYGSYLNFELNLADSDSLYLEKNGQFSKISLKSKFLTRFDLNVRESGEYNLFGSNRYIEKKNLLNFTVTCIPDLYPGIQVSEIQDSLHNSVHYFYGLITDDYGFSALRFNYSANNRTNTVIPIPVSKNVNTYEFYFSFDFAEFAGMDKTKISYFFEIFDNDNLSGPKSTRSDQKVYDVPDLNTIFDYNIEVANTVNSSLKDAEKLAGEIVSGVKELQKKMFDNNVDHWEKQQLSKDLIEKKKKLDNLLNVVKENNLKKSDLNRSFTAQDSALLDKQKQIQGLLDKIMDDEMKNLMKEFSKLSEEFSKEKFDNLDEKMKLTFDQMSQELDRNIELLKRFQIEERHDLISKQLDKLKSDQKELKESIKNNSLTADSLSALRQQIKENADHVRKNYSDLLKDNETLSEPYSLDDFKSSFDKLSEEVDKQNNNLDNKKQTEKLAEQIQKDMEDLADQMEEQQKQNFSNNSLPQNDIELIIQNILIISLSEEKLLKAFPEAAPQSLKYNELGQLQDLKRQEYKIVKDSLSVLAKSNLMLASLLSHKFYDIETKFGLLPGYIQDGKRAELAREQQYIINYLNDIALSLTDALQKDKQQRSKGGGKEKSKENKGNSTGKDSEGYDRMKKFQNNLKKQLENMVAQMRKGEKGKPLQQGISNMIRENEIFRKSLNDFISESGSISNAEKQLLNEINQLLDENIRDLSNYSVSNQVINRNNLIYNKLLMSEKASKQKEEFEEKRKSESASDTQYQRPDIMFDVRKKSSLIKTDFYRSDLKLNDYFKNMYNNYYIKLGNE